MSGRLDLHIPAIQCEGHLDAVRSIVESVGAAFEEGDLDTRRVIVLVDGTATPAEVEETLAGFGYPAEQDGSAPGA